MEVRDLDDLLPAKSLEDFASNTYTSNLVESAGGQYGVAREYHACFGIRESNV